ncbi:hypothetical protein [Candidatus Nitrospira neomarina]|uniref:Uncharacterized protein n=1 Tax=Candidatus Nitrospira neomarina TaxID=3020899 RepID=A0AA96GMC7_9BACT|nr:hypothetical protein [Candidatus Nitrospira neomarina]WNM61803.1 hypothetical protein PQG83_18975 [Candidatus Nitrospira neomarina]
MKIQPKSDLIHHQWHTLARACDDGESQTRLAILWEHIHRFPVRQAASAHAEIETAYFLAQAGFSVAFLEASGGRTADLECYEGTHRFFVEVTVIQSTQGPTRKSPAVRLQPHQILESSDEFFEQALVRRLLSRMAEKARQLERYCAPVLLAVSVPDLPWRNGRPQDIPPLDLQRLAAMLVGVVVDVPQFSAILLTLWKAPAQELRNPIRIRQVTWVTRPPGDARDPRIRLLAVNPVARYRLTSKELASIKERM